MSKLSRHIVKLEDAIRLVNRTLELWSKNSIVYKSATSRVLEIEQDIHKSKTCKYHAAKVLNTDIPKVIGTNIVFSRITK